MYTCPGFSKVSSLIAWQWVRPQTQRRNWPKTFIRCLSLAGPTVTHLDFFGSSEIYGSFAILFSFLCDAALHKLENIHAS